MSQSRIRTRLSDIWEKPGQHPPLIVAELSGNHNQSLDRALRLIEAAAESGADAIKLQTYTADTITLDAPQEEFHVKKPGSVWDGRSLYSLYQEAYTPWEWHEPMARRAMELGLEWFSSPFDFTAVDFLKKLDVPCYKIASPELIDLPLIKRCAQTGKPLVMSTGMATVAEIEEAVNAARSSGCTQLVLLKCTTDYPAAPENSHLRTIPHMAQMFQCPAGASDHTLSIGAAIAATAQGAALIEKHLTLRRADGGPDSHFSLEPEEFKALVNECHTAWAALGQVWYGPQEAERGFMRGRRSLYVAEDIRAGDVLTPQNLRSIRPGFGLHPKHYEHLLGKKVVRDVCKGTAMTWEIVGN